MKTAVMIDAAVLVQRSVVSSSTWAKKIMAIGIAMGTADTNIITFGDLDIGGPVDKFRCKLGNLPCHHIREHHVEHDNDPKR